MNDGNTFNQIDKSYVENDENFYKKKYCIIIPQEIIWMKKSQCGTTVSNTFFFVLFFFAPFQYTIQYYK